MDHLAVDGGLQPAAGCRSGVASHYAVPGHLPLDRKGERGGGLEIIENKNIREWRSGQCGNSKT